MKSSGENEASRSTAVSRMLKVLLASAMLWSIAAVNVFWVGSVTIYSPDRELRRAVLHRAVLEGQLPPGVDSWSSLGANSAALRPLVPWIAETLVSWTSLDLSRSYQLIEFVSIIAAFALLFLLLQRGGSVDRALVWCLYVAALLPLSYFMHYFHPWDKPSLALWLIAILFLLGDRLLIAAIAIVLAVLAKFDAVVLPMLYVLLFAGRMPWRRFITRLALLSAAAVGPFLGLLMLRPAAGEPRDLAQQLAVNIRSFSEHWYMYPPALGLALPLALGTIGFRHASWDERALYVFALLITSILFVTTNFIEIRAEFVPLVLMLPCASRGLDRIFARRPAQAASAA